MTPKPKGTSPDQFHVQVMLAGREGTQEEYLSNKREAIRRCKRLVQLGSFGSAGAVYVVGPARGPQLDKPGKRTLIYQCHKALNREGREFVKQDEL